MSSHHIYPHRENPVFKAAVIFGSPKRDCSLLGICKVISRQYKNSYAEDDFTPCQRVDANLHIDCFGRLAVHICAKTICAETKAYHFQNDRFRVLDPYTFEPAACQALGRAGQVLQIKPGNYPALVTEEGIFLSLGITYFSALEAGQVA